MEKTAESVNRLIRERFRQVRAETGLSLMTIGDAVGVGYQAVQKYQNGKVDVKAARLQALAEVLGVPISYFFEAADHQKPDIEPCGHQALELMRSLQRIERDHPVRFLALFEMVKKMAKNRARSL